MQRSAGTRTAPESCVASEMPADRAWCRGRDDCVVKRNTPAHRPGVSCRAGHIPLRSGGDCLPAGRCSLAVATPGIAFDPAQALSYLHMNAVSLHGIMSRATPNRRSVESGRPESRRCRVFNGRVAAARLIAGARRQSSAQRKRVVHPSGRWWTSSSMVAFKRR